MAEVTLPPPARGALWRRFLTWVVGVPALVLAVVAVIGAALWATGSGGMMPRTESDMGTAILMLCGIVLLYPAMLFVWTSELRSGLKARRNWDAMTPEAQAAAIAAQASARPASKRRRSRRKVGAA